MVEEQQVVKVRERYIRRGGREHVRVRGAGEIDEDGVFEADAKEVGARVASE